MNFLNTQSQPYFFFFFSLTFANSFGKEVLIPYQHGIAMHGDLKYPKNFKKV